jgi:hypothetical protein
LPANVVKLRTGITAAVAEVTPKMLRIVYQEIDYKWDVCSNGSQIETQLYVVTPGVFSYNMTVQNIVHVL